MIDAEPCHSCVMAQSVRHVKGYQTGFWSIIALFFIAVSRVFSILSALYLSLEPAERWTRYDTINHKETATQRLQWVPANILQIQGKI